MCGKMSLQSERKKEMKYKGGRKPKHDVEMTELFQLRLTAEQKSLICSPASSTGGGTAEYVRSVMGIVSESFQPFVEGRLSPEDFEKVVGSKIREFIVTSMEKGSEVKEPE
jgi:hypothetical protein